MKQISIIHQSAENHQGQKYWMPLVHIHIKNTKYRRETKVNKTVDSELETEWNEWERIPIKSSSTVILKMISWSFSHENKAVLLLSKPFPRLERAKNIFKYMLILKWNLDFSLINVWFNARASYVKIQ